MPATISNLKFAPGIVSDIFHTAVEDCTARLITSDKDVKAFFNLHMDVYWSLPVSKQHFYKRVSYIKMLQHNKAGHKTLGLFGPEPEMPLLAGTRLTLPEMMAPDAQGVRGGLADHPFEVDGYTADQWLHIQTLSAHPKTNGTGGVYTDAVFAGVEKTGIEMGRTMASGKLSWGNADASLNNVASFKAFARNGYQMYDQPAHRGIDFYKSVIMVKSLTPGI